MAELVTLTVKAGQRLSHALPWRQAEPDGAVPHTLTWRAKELEGFDVSLEVTLRLGAAEANDSDGSGQHVEWLQPNKSGGDFDGYFRPYGETATRLEEVVFEFDNTHSWFRAKTIHLTLILQHSAENLPTCVVARQTDFLSDGVAFRTESRDAQPSDHIRDGTKLVCLWDEGKLLRVTHAGVAGFVDKDSTKPFEPELPGLSTLVSKASGDYSLAAGDDQRMEGRYTMDLATGKLTDDEAGEVGTFTCNPLLTLPLEDLGAPTDVRIPCITVVESEVIAEIQKKENEGAIFVLPSQLNGAEYPSHDSVVESVEDYKLDDTGGPRGQLAVHPAAAQFLLDNAARDGHEGGISAVDQILKGTADFSFALVNGYLKLPEPETPGERDEAFDAFWKHLPKLRQLVMIGVPTCGLAPSKGRFCCETHKVSLVYASAVPLDSFVNCTSDPETQQFHLRVAEAMLVAQYYGALRNAAWQTVDGQTTKVFLTPLGGGAFNNPWTSIAKSMALAVEMLGSDEISKLDVRALACSGNPMENDTLEGLLRKHHKLREGIDRFVSKISGDYSLTTADGDGLVGTYTFDRASSKVKDGMGNDVGTFSCDPIAASLPMSLDAPAVATLPCIAIAESEIMAEIQKRENMGAYFVLPSQLNGVEYPSHDGVVDRVEDYKFDNTGGPRGQLAAHPAVAQFLLDNAACDSRTDGINALDKVLKATKKAGATFEVVNGYLKLPELTDPVEQDQALDAFVSHLGALRPLVMAGVPACGLSPNKGEFSAETHKVNLIYASAVPLQSYLNCTENSQAEKFHKRIAEAVLVAQYYGALRVAAQQTSNGRKTKVYLMPLGGGVFNNSRRSIAKSMALAVEMLASDELVKLDVKALTWSGDASESNELRDLLSEHGKLVADADQLAAFVDELKGHLVVAAKALPLGVGPPSFEVLVKNMRDLRRQCEEFEPEE